ncbi:DoxX family protein [Agrococcus sp. ARC_14]|uniref:DoxX family protein n=1 Tax=Agrococcus sp. ARC_14 TaxID=2919927 RepID=UPI001F059125|nr:DoxX family protein [Agrococcus sp. ARC_14]MCH1882308.1 DoxX family protein [Agrococcus sp. ARC_14]
MTLILPEPIWPVVVLAVISLGDAAISWKPVPFVAQCWEDVRFPKRYWRVLAWLKIAAGVGLIAGLWIPFLGLLTTACLVAYFVVAIAFHIRARDFSRNLFVNATGMLVLCVAVLLWSFLL